MKRTFIFILSIIIISTVINLPIINSAQAKTNYEVDESYDFEPQLANSLKLKWFSSKENRAMLTLLLGIQVADDRVLGSMDVFNGFLYNTSYLGMSTQKVSSGATMNMYVLLGRYDKYFIYITYSPEAKQATFFLKDNNDGEAVTDMQMEVLISNLCSEYYKNDYDDMINAVTELQKMIN